VFLTDRRSDQASYGRPVSEEFKATVAPGGAKAATDRVQY
jgi:hypothetical protein